MQPARLAADVGQVDARFIIPLTLGVALLSAAPARGGTPGGRVRALACAPSAVDVGAVLIGESVWITVDGGGRWRRVALLPGRVAEAEASEPEPLLEEWREVVPAEDSAEGTERVWIAADLFGAGAGAPPAESEPDGDSPAPRLAIGDDGRWVVAFDGAVFSGAATPGVAQRQSLPGVRGLAIDRRNRLLLTTADELRLARIDARGVITLVGSWLGADLGAPALGEGGATIAVPSRAGLWLLPAAGEVRPSLRPGESLHAVAGVETGWIVAAGTRIRRWRDGKQFGGAEPLPGRAERLLLDRRGRLLAAVTGRGWFELQGTAWRPVTARELAVDAAGRRWAGTDLGPLTPDRARAGPQGPGAPRLDRARLLSAGGETLERSPGPPPCRRHPFNPLPLARIVAGYGRGELHGAALPGPAYRERYRTWAYVAINLSWRFDPIPAAECAALRARFSELRSARLRKVAELSIAWERAAEARAVASRIGAAVAARVELERIGALIEVTSGNQLQTKERE